MNEDDNGRETTQANFLKEVASCDALFRNGAGWGYTRAGASYDAVNQSITDRTQLYGAFALMAAVGLVTGIVILARWASPSSSASARRAPARSPGPRRRARFRPPPRRRHRRATSRSWPPPP